MAREEAQISMSFPRPRPLVVASGLQEPRVWVRRLVLWHDVAVAPVRTETLQRGLNIVWSPSGNANDDERPSFGHAAGKSLFCRMIRYCLGERAFADSDDTEAIRARFSAGGVGAEVMIDGQLWAVRRGFTVRPISVAMQGGDVLALPDDATDGFDAYLSALQATLGGAEQLAHYPEPGDGHPWRYILSWLTRDQECRIERVDRWRYRKSRKQPARPGSSDQRIQALRVALNLYDEHAHQRTTRIVELAERHREAGAHQQQTQHQLETVIAEIAKILEIPNEEVAPPEALLEDPKAVLERHRVVLLERANARIRAVSVASDVQRNDPDELRLADLAERLGRAMSEHGSVQENWQLARERRALLNPELSKHQNALGEAKFPTCPYDDAPLDVEESKRQCPLVKFPDVDAAKRLVEETKDELLKLGQRIAGLESEEARLAGEIGRLQAEQQQLARLVERKLQEEGRVQAAQSDIASQAWSLKQRLIPELFNLEAERNATRRATVKADENLEEARAEEKAALSGYSTMALSDWFDVLVRRIVAPEASGRVTLDGNGLHPVIKHRRSVALNSLQVVLFDLAALLCAVEGRARIPAFLVHDSPREGDLDLSTYRRVFHAILDLAPDPDQAPFQYIVTTTTEPPDAAKPYVRITLGSDEPANRLLMVDL